MKWLSKDTVSRDFLMDNSSRSAKPRWAKTRQSKSTRSAKLRTPRWRSICCTVYIVKWTLLAKNGENWKFNKYLLMEWKSYIIEISMIHDFHSTRWINYSLKFQFFRDFFLSMHYVVLWSMKHHDRNNSHTTYIIQFPLKKILLHWVKKILLIRDSISKVALKSHYWLCWIMTQPIVCTFDACFITQTAMTTCCLGIYKKFNLRGVPFKILI